MGKLAKKYFPTETGYGSVQVVIDELKMPNDKSYWALMSKDVLNGSRNKSFKKQQKMVSELSKKASVQCEVPKALEAVVSILTHQVRSGVRLFSDNPVTYTRCLEELADFQVLVGGFAPSGLRVPYLLSYANPCFGVAVLRKFRSLAIG
ncbi:MAG: hypothetical protein H0W50_10440 [Parachlamydiaceae bacterium]|nr:hypothetical protein [Parachlamydiaceae bacterium]